MKKTLNDDILITIFNYDNNNNAIKLLDKFSNDFETIVLDSGSPIKNDRFILLDNIYYNGLVNESYIKLKELNKKYLLFITSDVEITDDNYIKLVSFLSNQDNLKDIGIYSPSAIAESKAHKHCLNDKNNNSLKDVWFVEGYFTLINEIVIDCICPINLTINKMGWCTDLLMGYHCNKQNLKCVIDNNITIYHPHGTGYDTNIANSEMNAYINYLGDEDFARFVGSSLSNGNK